MSRFIKEVMVGAMHVNRSMQYPASCASWWGGGALDSIDTVDRFFRDSEFQISIVNLAWSRLTATVP